MHRFVELTSFIQNRATTVNSIELSLRVGTLGDEGLSGRIGCKPILGCGEIARVRGSCNRSVVVSHRSVVGKAVDRGAHFIIAICVVLMVRYSGQPSRSHLCSK